MLEQEKLAVIDDTEVRLRAEIEDLKRRLELQLHAQPRQHAPKRPSRGALWTIALLAAVLIVVAFFTGYIPHQRREAVLAELADLGQELNSDE